MFNQRMALTVLITVLITLSMQSSNVTAVVKEYSSQWEEEISVLGGRTILVEELSATWCASCAEIDPYLQQVADSHGSRISIVTYHPTDGEDAFQPEAASHRINRMKMINPELGSTPAFVVEGGEVRVGPNSWPDVQKDILKKETENQQYSQLGFNINKNLDQYTAKITNFNPISVEYNTQVTFILMKHELTVPEGFVNPAGDYRDRVVTGVATCNLIENNVTQSLGFTAASSDNCSDNFSVSFNDSEKFSLVLIHESTENELDNNSALGENLGLVEFAYRDITIEDTDNYLSIVVISIISIGVLWAIYERKTS
jgi:thiol-disulfide isomerase/thioredoxin